MPESVSVPVPTLLIAVVEALPLLPLAIFPANVVFALFPPMLNVAPQAEEELALNVVPLPAPVKPPSAMAVAPFRIDKPRVPLPKSKVAAELPVVPLNRTPLVQLLKTSVPP